MNDFRNRDIAGTDKQYGITRIDDDKHSIRAWRVSLRRQNKMIVKNFPDKKYGGKQTALAAAKAFRDEVIDKYPPTTRKEFCTTLRRNNTSGIPGVYRYAKPYRLKDGTIRHLWYWEAHWPTGSNKSEKATFSVNTYGEWKARQLAIAARDNGVSSLEGYYWASERGSKKCVSPEKFVGKTWPGEG